MLTPAEVGRADWRTNVQRSSVVARVFLLVLPLMGGCLPVVTHGPAVHPGGSGGGILSLGVGSTFRPRGIDEEPPAIVPALELFLRQGTLHGPFGTPAHLGIQVEPFALGQVLSKEPGQDYRTYLFGSDLDLYTQIGSSGRDRGIGIMAGIDHVAPYFEIGPPQRGSGTWFGVGQLSYVDTGDGHIVAGSASLARTESGYPGRAAHIMLTVYVGGRTYQRFTAGGPGAFMLVVGSLSLDFFNGPAPGAN